MKNFIAELLIKLAEKEEETNQLAIQVQTLEIIVTGLLQNLDKEQRLKFITHVETSLESLSHGPTIAGYDRSELNTSLSRLLLIQNDELKVSS
ncbi:sigma-S stabilization anti-adapter protein IraP [Citrobacter sp. JGM124]|uniref:sigma-S stabilization anti-adapter protein IraP n=1 Tax=Citrobacter sp. JGM124 TaxID=2799789 RepID=UPI001BABF33B|nr:sigma-S stabilization anti-adapter protein IraP [Citrobacter sp. JGM124]MBS0848767.1 anti-adapter protein IraP [Citrobacter sp. JGM124]